MVAGRLSTMVSTSSWRADNAEEDQMLKTPIPPEKTIVVMPLDQSDHSLYAMMYYVKHIHKPNNIVYACYVSEDFLSSLSRDPSKENVKPQSGQPAVPAPKPGCCQRLCSKWFDKVVVDVGPSPGVLAELREQDKQNYHKIRHRVKHLFRINNVQYVFRRLTGKDPGEVIINFRKEVHGSLIVMGSRGGRSAFKRKMFGSVSDQVIRNCLVPALVVKKPVGVASYDDYENEFHKETGIN